MESAWKCHMPSGSLRRAGHELSVVRSRRVMAEWPNCLSCCLSRPANLPSPSSSQRSTDSLVPTGLTVPSDPGSGPFFLKSAGPVSNKNIFKTLLLLCNGVITHNCYTLILENPEHYSRDLLDTVKQYLLIGIEGTSALRQCYTDSDYVTQKMPE